MITEGLSAREIDFIKVHPAASVHHGFGTGVRNNWNLWDRSTELNKWFQRHYGISHGDDLSGIILNAAWAKVRGTTYCPVADVLSYWNHWNRLGIDPLTQEKVR